MSDVVAKLKQKKREVQAMIREAERLSGANTPEARAQAHRERMAQRSRTIQSAVADIGALPAVVDPQRKDDCRLDLHLFLVTYFPASTGLKPFSEDHLHAIERLRTCILDGGLFIQVFPRGYGKTTITENAALWAVLYGHRRFVPIFGADAGAAGGNIDSIKLELTENDLLYSDFPEVCHAIRALEGKAQRCASQTYDGKLTHIEWGAELIVLPTIEGSPASGGIVTARGIMGGSRGMKHKRPDGTQQRPDFVLLDDPQTDESAGSTLQVDKRLNVIRKNILKLGGHNRKIAVVCNATVIEPDDVAEQLLDPKRFPAWQGERIKMVRKWSDAHESLWLEDYRRLRNTYDPELLGDQQRAHREATEFYRRNRAAMDSGCEVSWEHCFEETLELSAIQHAYNLLIDDGESVFASECQNSPLRPEEEQSEAATPAEIVRKASGLPRGVIPVDGSRLVAFIDPKKDVLYWTVAGFGEGFTGSVVDYGTWPDQRRNYFAAKDVRVTIEKVTKANKLEEQIYAALDVLVNDLMNREWKREDGAMIRPEKILIDAGWGDISDVVYQFCRRSPHSAVLMPSHGRGIGAKNNPLNHGQQKPGERRGWHWKIPDKPGRYGARYVLMDANAWKTRMHSLLKVPTGGKGCLSVFGGRRADENGKTVPAEPEQHRLFADHVCSEMPIKVEANGRAVTEWTLRPGRPDNDFLDCLVGCGVAASMLGISVLDQSRSRVIVKKMKLSEIQRQKAKGMRYDRRSR